LNRRLLIPYAAVAVSNCLFVERVVPAHLAAEDRLAGLALGDRGVLAGLRRNNLLLSAKIGFACFRHFARASCLRPLKGKTACSDGEWQFGSERRRWNGLQNVPSDVRQLTLYLMPILKRGLAKAYKVA